VLADPEKRARYDRFGHEGLRGESFQGFNPTIFEDFEDILGNFFGFNFGFGDLFGGRRQRAEELRGRDLALELEISLEEAAAGADKEIALNRAESCPVCRGSGMKPGTRKATCPTCGGRGQIRQQQGFFTLARTCSRCGGSGEIIPSPCEECRGSGTVRSRHALKVRVPGGVADGSRLRMAGVGEAGVRGAGRGDLYIVIRVRPHVLFAREGQHLTCEISLSFAQAALGVTVEVPLLSGEAEKLKIPPGTQSGEVFRIRGAGVRDLESRRTGDLYVRVLVRTPGEMSKEQKSILRQFAASRGESLETIGRAEARVSAPDGRREDR
jgi:molecular chaperone DnaJ